LKRQLVAVLGVGNAVHVLLLVFQEPTVGNEEEEGKESRSNHVWWMELLG
jgi:hypothetical protein